MRILAMETTAAIASAALYADGEVVCVRRADSSRKHAETLLPMIDDILREHDLTAADMDYFAVDIGPGSFTGVRIGVTVANALAYAANKSVIAVNALQTLSEPFFAAGRSVLAMIDARNGNAYAAAYCGTQELLAPCAEKIGDILAKAPADAVAVGDVCCVGFAAEEAYRLPDAKWLAHAAARLTSTATEAAVPMYLRPSQAERMRKETGKC